MRFERTDLAIFESTARRESGIGFYDVDGDGADEVLLTRERGIVGVLRDSPAGLVETELRFSAGSGAAIGALAPSDFDGDGVMDVFVGYTDGAPYFLRGVRGGLRDLSALAFDGEARKVHNFAFADLDGDGRLDVYLTTGFFAGTPIAPMCDRDALFLQREDGFVRVRVPDEDLASPAGCGFSAVFWDQDGDGDPDGAVTNDFGTILRPNDFLVNRGVGPDGQFRMELSTRATPRPWAMYGMGIGVGDIDGDGILDVASTSLGRAPVLRGRGDGTFEDITERLGAGGMNGYDGVRVTWSVMLDDLDGDGRADLFESGGYMVADPIWDVRLLGSPSFVWHGSPGTPFDEDALSLVQAAGAIESSRSAVLGDVDGNGAPDLLFSGAFGSPAMLLRNRTAAGPWLAVTPRGTVSPREARGAIVTLVCGAHRSTAVVSTGGHVGGMSAPRVYLSLAPCRTAPAAELSIAWPSGVRTVTPVDPRTGGRLSPEEPRWFAADRAWLSPAAGLPSSTVTVRPLDDRGRPLGPGRDVRLRLVAGDGAITPVTAAADGSYRAVVSARNPGELWVAATIDGRTPHARIRLPVRDANPSLIRVAPAMLLPRRPSQVVVIPRRADGTPLGAGMAPVLEATHGTLVEPLADYGDGSYGTSVWADGSRQPVSLRLAVAGVPERRVMVPLATTQVDPVGSTVVLEPGYVPLGLTGARVTLKVAPRTPGGATLTDLEPGSVTLHRSDGRRIVSDPRPQIGFVDFSVDVDEVGTEPFEVRYGATVLRTMTVHRWLDSIDLDRAVDPARSQFFAVQPVMRADGAAETDVVLVPRNRHGDLIPLREATWSIVGGRVAPEATPPVEGQVHLRVVAGTVPGDMVVTARLRNGTELRSVIELVPPPPVRPVERLVLCASASPSVLDGEFDLVVRATPRYGNGIAAEEVRDLVVLRDDVPVRLAARAGSYAATLRVRADRPTLELRAIDRGSLRPPAPGALLVVGLTLPIRDLALTSPPPGAWLGEQRCATVTGPAAPRMDAAVPDSGAVDATAMDRAVPAGDAPAADAGGADALVPDATIQDAPARTEGVLSSDVGLSADSSTDGGPPARTPPDCQCATPAGFSDRAWIRVLACLAMIVSCARRRGLRSYGRCDGGMVSVRMRHRR